MVLSFPCSPCPEPSKWSLVSSFTLNPVFSILWIPCVVMDFFFPSPLLLWSSGMSRHLYIAPPQAILRAATGPALERKESGQVADSSQSSPARLGILSLSGACCCTAVHLQSRAHSSRGLGGLVCG